MALGAPPPLPRAERVQLGGAAMAAARAARRAAQRPPPPPGLVLGPAEAVPADPAGVDYVETVEFLGQIRDAMAGAGPGGGGAGGAGPPGPPPAAGGV